MSDTDAEILAILDAKIKHHRDKIQEHQASVKQHQAELDRYEASARPLRGSIDAANASNTNRVVRRRTKKEGTAKFIEQVLREHGHLTVAELTDVMLTRGWETTSENPPNNVRTQVNRMVEADLVAKTEDGRYFIGQVK